MAYTGAGEKSCVVAKLWEGRELMKAAVLRERGRLVGPGCIAVACRRD